MSKRIEMTGANVQEATDKALAELALTREDAIVEVLEEGEPGGFLGFGRKPAKVRVTAKPSADVEIEDAEPQGPSDTVLPSAYGTVEEATRSTEPVTRPEATTPERRAPYTDSEGEGSTEGLEPEEIARRVQTFLADIQANMKLNNTVETHYDGKTLVVNIQGDDCGILIGRRGDTLRSLTYLTSLYANRLAGSRVELNMDIGNYKNKREHSVADLAIRTAKKALATGNAYELNPMGSNDRRIVHETLSDFEGIYTYSEGDEPGRYVVIDLADAMSSGDSDARLDGDDELE